MPDGTAQTDDAGSTQLADPAEASEMTNWVAGEETVSDAIVSTGETAADDPTKSNHKRKIQQQFLGHNGQALLLVYRSLEQYSAVTKIHVDRPSTSWKGMIRRRWAQAPKGCARSRETIPEVAERQSTKGDSDELVWRSISDIWWQRQIWWRRYIPFWRPVKIDEVKVSPRSPRSWPAY